MNTKLIKLASEKCLNKFSFPIISIKGKPILKYPYHVRWEAVHFICHKGNFGPRDLMIMDILGTYIIHKLYNNFGNDLPDFSKRIPTSKDSKVKDNSNQFISYKLLHYLIERLKFI